MRRFETFLPPAFLPGAGLAVVKPTAAAEKCRDGALHLAQGAAAAALPALYVPSKSGIYAKTVMLARAALHWASPPLRMTALPKLSQLSQLSQPAAATAARASTLA